MFEEIKTQAATAASEIIKAAKLEEGDILVIGCSTSEVMGSRIGTNSSEEAARAIFGAIWSEAEKAGVRLAAQCCEHLNRALIVEEECRKQYGLVRVNAVPQKHAGGSFAAVAYGSFEKPVAVEKMRCAKAGLDIGDTFIGMHMEEVCVPVRLSLNSIGEAHLSACRARPKFIGGERAVYDPNLK